MRNLKLKKRCCTVVSFALIIIFSFSTFSVLGQIEQDPGSRYRTLKIDSSVIGNMQRMQPGIISTDNLQTAKNIVVPRLLGSPWNYNQISKFLKGMQLKLGTATPVVDNENIGIITSQSIPSRTFVSPFTAINITYGVKGAPEIIEVPQYIGLNSNVAIRNIQIDYLSLGNIRMMDSDYPNGVVISQFPTQGMKVDPGTRIDLDISQGPPAVKTVVVPQLEGRLWNNRQIFDLLKEIGLKLGTVTPVVNNQAIGKIVNQFPVAQTQVPPSTAINLTYGIQATPDRVIVGRYTGLNREIAIQHLSNDRLALGNIREEFSEEPAGIVITQFPTEKMEVNAGTRINLIVSLGAAEVVSVAVPELIGHSMNEAAEILKSVGLSAGQFSSKPVVDKKPGTVIEQSPPAGTVVNKNSTVDITFSVTPANEFIVVPDVTGMWRDDAIRTLKKSKLNYAIVYVENSGENVGKVVRQSISPGEKVPPGTSVIIEVRDKRVLPLWIYGVGALLLAGLLGAGIIKRKIKTGKNRKKVVGENAKLKLKVVWDEGEQKVFESIPELTKYKLNLKIIPDRGEQTLKIN